MSLIEVPIYNIKPSNGAGGDAWMHGNISLNSGNNHGTALIKVEAIESVEEYKTPVYKKCEHCRVARSGGLDEYLSHYKTVCLKITMCSKEQIYIDMKLEEFKAMMSEKV